MPDYSWNDSCIVSGIFQLVKFPNMIPRSLLNYNSVFMGLLPQYFRICFHILKRDKKPCSFRVGASQVDTNS